MISDVHFEREQVWLQLHVEWNGKWLHASRTQKTGTDYRIFGKKTQKQAPNPNTESTQLSVAVGRNTLWKLFFIVSLVLQAGQIFFTWMAALMHPSQKICPQTVEHGETNAPMQIGQLKVGSFGATFSGTGLLTFFLCHSSDTMCREKISHKNCLQCTYNH